MLPEVPRRGDEGGCLESYREFLDHNELELALDELQLLGDANDVPPAYWEALASAARLMELERRVEACESRIKAG
jgi:hypothetical protein